MEDAVKRLLETLVRQDAGQDLVEYALLAALIAVASVAALNTLGPTVAGFYQDLGATLASF